MYKIVWLFPQNSHCASKAWISWFTIDCLQKIVLQFCTMKGIKETFKINVILKETLFRLICWFWSKKEWPHHKFSSTLNVAQWNWPRGTWKYQFLFELSHLRKFDIFRSFFNCWSGAAKIEPDPSYYYLNSHNMVSFMITTGSLNSQGIIRILKQSEHDFSGKYLY